MRRLRRGGPFRTGDDGFTLVEMTMALAILAVTAAFFAAQLASSYTIYGKSRERTLAEEIATEQLERARDLDYERVGTNPGNPLGTIPKTKNVTLGGLTFNVTNTVTFVDDPVPARLASRTNYKQMRVIVARKGTTFADMQTLIAPRSQSSLTRGSIKVTVSDYYTNQVIPGATVEVTGGPSPSATDLTDGLGESLFVGLLPTEPTGPQSHYSIAARKGDYNVLPEYVAPAAAVYPTLVASQTFDTTIQMYKTVYLAVRLMFPDGRTFPYYADLTVTATGVNAVTGYWGGTTWINWIDSGPVRPGNQYSVSARATVFGETLVSTTPVTKVVPDDYPNVIFSEFVLVMPELTCPGSAIKVTDSNGGLLTGALVRITGGDGNVTLEGYTDYNGYVQIPIPGSVAPYTLTVPVQGAVTTEFTQPITVAACGGNLGSVVVPVPAVIPPETRQVTVTVHDINAVRIPGAGVWIGGGDYNQGVWFNVDADGTHLVTLPVSTTPYYVEAPAQGIYAREITSLTVAAAGPNVLDLELDEVPITPPPLL